MNFTVDVEQSTDAVFVGEPTGARPNLYGDVRPVQMPQLGTGRPRVQPLLAQAGDTDTRTTLDPGVRVEWTVGGPAGGTQCSMPPSGAALTGGSALIVGRVRASSGDALLTGARCARAPGTLRAMPERARTAADGAG